MSAVILSLYQAYTNAFHHTKSPDAAPCRETCLLGGCSASVPRLAGSKRGHQHQITLALALSTEVSNTPYLTFNQVPFPPLFCLPGLFLPSGFSVYPCGLSGMSLTDQWWNTYFVPVFSKETDEVWRSESQDLLLRPDRTPEGSQLPSPTHISWACTLVCKSPMGQINNA